MRILSRQRIHRKEPPNTWIVHSILVIHRVSFSLDLVIHFLTLKTLPSKGTTMTIWHKHSEPVIVSISYHVRQIISHSAHTIRFGDFPVRNHYKNVSSMRG